MSRRGDAVVLWDSLASLPVASSLVDDTDGAASIATKNGIRVDAMGGIVEIWRDDALDLEETAATGVLTLAANATRANALGTLTLVAQPTNTKAAGTLTLTGQPATTQTVTIGAKTYTFQDVLTNVDGNVLIGVDAAATIVNLVAAIMLGAGGGTGYAAATTLHPTVTAVDGAGDTVVATAKVGGTAGNSLASTDTMDNASWGAATLEGGTTETVTIDARVYTFKTVLLTAGDILIGATASDTLDNLIAAINAAAGAGSTYGTGTAVHATVVATAGAGDTMIATARAAGTAGNSLATTDGMANAGNVWGGATLASGAAAETVTIGATVYSFVNFLNGTAFQVLIGASASATLDNLIAAVNAAAGAGTTYGTGTTEHPTVDVAAGAGDTMDLTAVTGGTAGNLIATTETMAQGSFGAATLTGGATEVDITTTLDFPLYLYGWNGSAWMLDDTIAAADVAVGRQRGVQYETESAGLYERLALVATGATVPDNSTIMATYTPVLD